MSIHISAKPGEIEKIVLLAGDPLRAKYIADNFLQNVKLVSSTRNIYFFTGTYKDKPLTVGASGMGCPSIGIYSFELFTEYEAACIIRIGTCGAYTKKMKLFDLVNAETACSESTYAECAYGYKKDRFKYEGDAFDVINNVKCIPLVFKGIFFITKCAFGISRFATGSFRIYKVKQLHFFCIGTAGANANDTICFIFGK